MLGIWPWTARINGVVPSGSGSFGSTPSARKFSMAVRVTQHDGFGERRGLVLAEPDGGGRRLGAAAGERARTRSRPNPTDMDDRRTRIRSPTGLPDAAL